jgi:hypothetical protein
MELRSKNQCPSNNLRVERKEIEKTNSCVVITFRPVRLEISGRAFVPNYRDPWP